MKRIFAVVLAVLAIAANDGGPGFAAEPPAAAAAKPDAIPRAQQRKPIHRTPAERRELRKRFIPAPELQGGPDAVQVAPPVRKVRLKPVRERQGGSSSALTGARQATDPGALSRAVCQSQCNLERMSCDQGRASAYQNRADQLQAAQASCYLAVQSCLSRC